jgi:hypothetical protein
MELSGALPERGPNKVWIAGTFFLRMLTLKAHMPWSENLPPGVTLPDKGAEATEDFGPYGMCRAISLFPKCCLRFLLANSFSRSPRRAGAFFDVGPGGSIRGPHRSPAEHCPADLGCRRTCILYLEPVTFVSRLYI